jgi:hypothetical protein
VEPEYKGKDSKGALVFKIPPKALNDLEFQAAMITVDRVTNIKRDWEWVENVERHEELERCDFTGLVAEYVCHSYFNLKWNFQHYERGGDGGVDLVTRQGTKVQVKATPHSPAHLAVMRDEPHVADRYILCHVTPNRRIVRMVGYATKNHLVNTTTLGKLRQGGVLNYQLHEDSLNKFPDDHLRRA